MDSPIVPEVVAAYPGVDFTVPPTVIKPVHHGKGAPPPRLRIGEALVSAGTLTQAQLEECLAEQRRLGGSGTGDRRLGAIVVAKGLATENDIAAGIASITGFEHVDPTAMDLSPAVVRLIPQALARQLRVVPLDAGPSWVRVAAADPFNRRGIEAVRDVTGRLSVTLAVTTPAAVMLALDAAWDPTLEVDEAALPHHISAGVDAPVDRKGNVAPGDGSAPALAAQPERGPRWEYAFVGDDLPSSHPGYTPDLVRLDARLAELGALGWDAVSVVSHSGRLRVLLKRGLYRA